MLTCLGKGPIGIKTLPRQHSQRPSGPIFRKCVRILFIREAIEEQSKEGNSVPSFEDIRVYYHYDVPSFFNYFDFINISKFAAYAGINESKMRAYKSGIAYPGEKMTARILKAARTIGADLSAALL